MKISPITLTKGGFKERRNWSNKGVPIFFSYEIFTHNLQGTYDMVDKVWSLGTYIKVEGG